jgi:hypothetical protein
MEAKTVKAPAPAARTGMLSERVKLEAEIRAFMAGVRASDVTAKTFAAFVLPEGENASL